jgi:pseudouridine synthase
MLIRLQKILSSAGIASRRAAERLMAEGRVSVNGEVVRELGSKADPGSDAIRVDGRPVRGAARPLYFLLNKPRGYVTTRSDPEGRPTVLDLLPGVRDYVYPVGRLDYESEGLLILTNDGDLAASLMHPSHEVPREYHVRVRGLPDAHALRRLARGIVLDGRRTAPAQARLVESGLGPDGGQSVVAITLHEGRTRQVRRMCEAVGHPVVRLCRVRIGPIADPDLTAGTVRPLTRQEVAALKRAGPGLTASASRPRSGSGQPSRTAGRDGPPRRG